MREEVLSRLQSEDALADPHGREAVLLLVSRLPQALQPEVQSARPPIDTSFGGVTERGRNGKPVLYFAPNRPIAVLVGLLALQQDGQLG